MRIKSLNTDVTVTHEEDVSPLFQSTFTPLILNIKGGLPQSLRSFAMTASPFFSSINYPLGNAPPKWGRGDFGFL